MEEKVNMFNELRNFFLRYRYTMGDFMTEYVTQTKCLRYVFKCYFNIRNNRNCFLLLYFNNPSVYGSRNLITKLKIHNSRHYTY